MATADRAGEELVRRALGAPRATLADIAQALGRSPTTLKFWHLGKRHPSDADVLALADWLNGHAEKLRALAQELRREVRKGQR